MHLLFAVLGVLLILVLVDRIAGLGWVDARVWQIFMIVVAVVIIGMLLSAFGVNVPGIGWRW